MHQSAFSGFSSSRTFQVISSAAVAALLFAGLTACGGSPEVADQGSDATAAVDSGVDELDDYSMKPAEERAAAPTFELVDQNGDAVTLEDLKGQVVVLNYWATWCGPCRTEMPWFAEFEKTYKDQGFSVVGVSLDDEGWDQVKPYLGDHPEIDYRIVIGTESMAQLYGGISSLPTTFIIDRNGKIASIHTGLVSRESYEREIEELL